MPTTCLYIVAQQPIAPSFGAGGSVVYHEQLMSLCALGHEVHLWHYAYPDERRVFDEFVARDPEAWSAVTRACRSVTLTTLPTQVNWPARIGNRLANLGSRMYVNNPVFRSRALPVLRALIARVRPSVVWAQAFGPVQVALLQRACPVVYSHHDWLYRVRAIGAGAADDRRQQSIEERVAVCADVVVSGSATEAQELRAIGCRHVVYIPPAYEAPAFDASSRASADVRIVHLGGMKTTANRIGLQRFLEVVWPHVPRGLEAWVVGSLSGAPPALTAAIAPLTCTGYVDDLGTVLRPFDVHVIPWEHSTGQRTRAVLAAAYGQAILATRASIAGFPEFVDRRNCRLVDRLEDMGPVLLDLAANPTERERLGRAARRTFEDAFTRRRLLDRYAEALRRAGAAA